MSAEEFQNMLVVMLSPAFASDLRSNTLQALKYFTMSYISGIQGVLANTTEDDPIHAEALAALSEIETILMDR